MIKAAPCNIKITNICNNLAVAIVKEEIDKFSDKYLKHLPSHPNHLARAILNFPRHIRLKKEDIADLTSMEKYVRLQTRKLKLFN